MFPPSLSSGASYFVAVPQAQSFGGAFHGTSYPIAYALFFYSSFSPAGKNATRTNLPCKWAEERLPRIESVRSLPPAAPRLHGEIGHPHQPERDVLVEKQPHKEAGKSRHSQSAAKSSAARISSVRDPGSQPGSPPATSRRLDTWTVIRASRLVGLSLQATGSIQISCRQLVLVWYGSRQRGSRIKLMVQPSGPSSSEPHAM